MPVARPVLWAMDGVRVLRSPGSSPTRRLPVRRAPSSRIDQQTDHLAVRCGAATDATTLDWAALQVYWRAEDTTDVYPFTFRPFRGVVAVTSGSGDSSLVTAGSAPTLRTDWDTAELRPSEAADAPDPLALVGRRSRGVWGETAPLCQ